MNSYLMSPGDSVVFKDEIWGIGDDIYLYVKLKKDGTLSSRFLCTGGLSTLSVPSQSKLLVIGHQFSSFGVGVGWAVPVMAPDGRVGFALTCWLKPLL